MVLIRVDFGSKIGFGHLKRVENFVKKGIIICKECEQKYTKFPIIQINSKEEFFKKVKELKPKEVIVDNYEFNFEDEKEFKKLFPKTKLICFDDFEKEHFCDEVVSLNPCSRHKVIKIKLKKRYFKQKGIMISIGATDPKGIVFKILKYLKQKDIHIYTTSKNPNLKKLKKLKNITLHIDEDLKIAMFKHKFGIFSASTTAIEAIAAKLPFIAIKVVDNQENIAKCLIKKRVKVLSEREINKVSRFIPSRKKRSFRVEK